MLNNNVFLTFQRSNAEIAHLEQVLIEKAGKDLTSNKMGFLIQTLSGKKLGVYFHDMECRIGILECQVEQDYKENKYIWIYAEERNGRKIYPR
jgi:hypothetical protein